MLVRDDIRPKVVDQLQTPMGVWDPRELPHRDAHESDFPGVCVAFADLLEWLAKYENWITKNRPSDHRERTLREWKRVAIPAIDTAEAWCLLGREIRELSQSRQAIT